MPHINTYTEFTLLNPYKINIMSSLESSISYPKIITDRSKFDITMKYQMNSDVPLPYLSSYINTPINIFIKQLPFLEKLPNLIFLNSNCNTDNNREDIVSSIIKDGRITVHSYGNCLKNKYDTFTNKIQLFRKYRFCIAIENSNTKDYITEKLWESFESGCLPIYYGAPNINEYLPDPNSIINYEKIGGTPEALINEFIRLGSNETEYNKKFEWKTKPKELFSKGFLKYLKLDETSPHCRLCQFIAKKYE